MTKIPSKALQAKPKDVIRLLEVIKKYDSFEMNWSQVVNEWCARHGNLTRLYRAIPTCQGLGLISYEKGKYIKLEPNGEDLLTKKDIAAQLEFLGGLLVECDKQYRTLEALLRAYDKFSLVRGVDSLTINQIKECQEELGIVAENTTLYWNLITLYKEVGLVEVQGKKIRLNIERYEELSKKRVGRGEDEVVLEEFFEVLVKVYRSLSIKSGTRYVLIPEIRRDVIRELKLAGPRVFDNLLLKLAPSFHNRKIVLISPRGPREGAIERERPDGSFERYLHILID